MSLATAKIVVVDDNDIVRETLIECLSGVARATLGAENGIKALEILRREGDVDVVVTDIFMPGMEGIELICTLKKEFPQTTVVVMSGGSSRYGEYLDSAVIFGAACVLEKPFSQDDLCRAIDQLRGARA